jgi:hypothetical protein
MRRFFLGALFDFLATLQRAIPVVRPQSFAVILLTTVMVWWIYVPVHELLHVAGCVFTGGEVSRLEISPEYGAAFLQKIFPFVTVGSDYAGQLTGFDTHGNDLIYIATVFAPYLLTLFVGAPLLRGLALRGRDGIVDRLAFGAAIPLAFAPFINLAGDYYELASIPVSRLTAAIFGGEAATWRSDDIFLLAKKREKRGHSELTAARLIRNVPFSS